MTLRDTVSKWHTAMCLLEENKFTEAAQKLLEIHKQSAKIVYNIGCLYMLQEKYEYAIQYFNTSIDQDKHLALALYQRAICHLEIKRYEEARSDFLEARSVVHKDGINYRQLGAEIELTHELLDHCLDVTKERWNKKNPVKLPVRDCIFRPPKAMVNNLVKQDFLGNAKIISSTEEKDIVTASESRKLLDPGVSVKNRLASSVPSSPVSSRYQLNTSSAKRIFIPPPPPKRPPPRLPSSIAASHNLHLKSRSLEDVTAANLLCEGTEEFTQLLISDTEEIKPVLINHLVRKEESKVTSASQQQGINSHPGDFETVLPCRYTNHDAISQPSLDTVSIESSHCALRTQNLIGNKLDHFDSNSSRTALEHIKPNAYLDQDLKTGKDCVIGHAARMKLMFEKGQISGQLQPKKSSSNAQKGRLDMTKLESFKQNKVQTGRNPSEPQTVHNCEVLAKPTRPSPSKFSK